MMKKKFESAPIVELAKDLLAIDSPGGYTGEVNAYLEKTLKEMGFTPRYTNKQALYVDFPEGEAPRRMVTAHIDTLGAMVTEICDNGRLRFSNIGGWDYHCLETESVRVHCASGKVLTGTILSDKASVHIYHDIVRAEVRDYDTMAVRLDILSNSAEETRAAGVELGDFICFETHTEFTDTGFLKSRFLDNKVDAAILLEVLSRMVKAGEKPAEPTRLLFSNYEEMGHGVASPPDSIREILALDIGTVGEKRNSRETQVTIVCKDSRTPYPFDFRQRLAKLAQDHGVEHCVDVHIRYGSDGSLAAVAGIDMDFACIGPGVDSTHSLERTHERGILATAELLDLYMRN